LREDVAASSKGEELEARQKLEHPPEVTRSYA